MTVSLDDLPDGRYFDGTYEWDKDGNDWTPLLAPYGMASHPSLGALKHVTVTYTPVAGPVENEPPQVHTTDRPGSAGKGFRCCVHCIDDPQFHAVNPPDTHEASCPTCDAAAHLSVTTAQIEQASADIQLTHGKSGRARDVALLRALGVVVDG